MTKPLILLPVDGSEHALRAAEYSVKIATMMNARLFLLHCHRPFPVKLGDPYFQKAIDKIMQQSAERLAPFRSLLDQKGADYTELILEGPAGEKICEVARIEKSEMIVMGSRGRSNLTGLFLGSVAHRVLHQAPCPVLIVR
ncbi:universal stress protein [Desulfosarcina widdelii]|uniref:Universal stress protein n=1 Tax=Desulfosarcina widdelii TaxID=947919 RepID=A0A5K7YW60_9BACT|nr:universal stress protein [Desulfosarcina widdelii]BBO72858.1 universal stress protein [Desulfosarcina widdelii]